MAYYSVLHVLIVSRARSYFLLHLLILIVTHSILVFKDIQFFELSTFLGFWLIALLFVILNPRVSFPARAVRQKLTYLF